jgi:Mitochondrial carrier protein
MIIATSATQRGGDAPGNLIAKILGSAVAGLSELIVFHPVDTVAKRLMSHEGRVIQTSVNGTMSLLNTVIFKGKAESNLLQKYASLFPGLGFGAGYKITQRVYKFGGQPIVKDYITRHHSDKFESLFGKRNAKTIMYATAGSIMGIGEIVLLPLDVLKIKAQTNPESLKGRGLLQIIKDEGRNLYKGGAWTAARNAPGSFALFGGSAVCKEYIFKLENYNNATVFQDSVASVVGAVASITVAAPLDVIKTRIQNKPFDSKENGVTILRNLISKEGFGAFFKGLSPKIIVVGPKLVFSFTIAQQMMNYFDKIM